MGDKDALYAAILREPAEDMPRLALADWLDEFDGSVPCPKCGGSLKVLIQTNPYVFGECKTCKGLGSVPNPEPEFIRVQCELARTDPNTLGSPNHEKNRDPRCQCRWCVLTRRERELLLYENCKAWLPDGFTVGNNNDGPWGTNTRNAVFRRGFVAEVRCPLATWRGGDCERCNGRRYLGATAPGQHGFIGTPDCPTCHGEGRTPGIGSQVMARWPVECVRVVGKEPFRYDGSDLRVWYRESGDPQLRHPEQSRLPDEVFDLLEGRWIEGGHREGRWKTFATPADAHAALSAVLIAEAKDRAAKLALTVR